MFLFFFFRSHFDDYEKYFITAIKLYFHQLTVAIFIKIVCNDFFRLNSKFMGNFYIVFMVFRWGVRSLNNRKVESDFLFGKFLKN